MFRDDLHDEITQGDVFSSVDVVDTTPDGPRTRHATLLLLSHECDFDKLRIRSLAEHALALEVRDGTAVDPGTWGHIRAGRVWNALLLPDGPLGAERFVDFRRVYRVRKEALMKAQDNRLVSLTDEGREVVIYALASFLLRVRLDAGAQP